MRPRQRMILAAAGEPVFTRLQRNERGEYEFKEVNDSKVVLPDCSTTDIQALLEAGIDPKRVDTKILGPSQFVTDLASDDTKTDNSTENEGDN